MKERLEGILLHYGLSSAQFADSIGVQRSSISHIISGRNKPSFDFIQKIILKYSEINADWLLTGQGNIIKSVLPQNKHEVEPNSTETTDLFTQSPLIESITADFNPEESVKHPSSSTQNKGTNQDVTNVNRVKNIILIYEDDSFKVLSGR